MSGPERIVQSSLPARRCAFITILASILLSFNSIVARAQSVTDLLNPPDKAVAQSIPYRMAKMEEREIVANLYPFQQSLKQIDALKLDVTTTDTDLQEYLMKEFQLIQKVINDFGLHTEYFNVASKGEES